MTIPEEMMAVIQETARKAAREGAKEVIAEQTRKAAGRCDRRLRNTKLLLKKLAPTRLVKGGFTTAVEEAEAQGASVEEMRALLGKGRAKKGMFEGNLEEGELEIGQVAALFRKEETVAEVMEEIITGYRQSLGRLKDESGTF